MAGKLCFLTFSLYYSTIKEHLDMIGNYSDAQKLYFQTLRKKYNLNLSVQLKPTDKRGNGGKSRSLFGNDPTGDTKQ